MSARTERIDWQPATALPDSDETVLVFAPTLDEPVWMGFWNGEEWLSVDVESLGDAVTHWARMPEGPDRARNPH